MRSDITLQSLEAKSVRLMALAQIHNCSVVNLSKLPKSRLLFPRTSITKLLKKIDQKKALYSQDLKLDSKSVKRADLNIALEFGLWTKPEKSYRKVWLL